VYPRLFQFGHVAIPTYGLFAALAIIAALSVAQQTARRFVLDTDKIWNLSLIGIFTALLGARLLLALLHPRDFLAHPFWMLGLVTLRSNTAFYGSLLLAICACIGYIFAHHLPQRRTLDCIAPAAAIGLGIRSLGAFAAGSGYGSPTTRPWGVVYMHRLAWLWSGTPLGVRLHPVQLYEATILFLLFFLLRRTKSEGTSAGIFLFVYGSTLYFLDFYRGNRHFLFAEAISSAQLLGIIFIFLSAAFLLKIPDRQQTSEQPSSFQV
jgi:phosphatidylglycerol:prolipoprotein diacylglycerol transferase